MYILFTYLKTPYSLSQFFAYLCVGRSVNTGVCWAHNVLYQMGAQRGVAWGLSPVSEMLIMNINKSYTYTHTHIWLQHLSVLLSRFFNAPLYHMNSWRSQALQFPLVSTGFSGSVFYTTLHEKSISVIWYPRSSHFPFAPDCTSPPCSGFVGSVTQNQHFPVFPPQSGAAEPRMKQMAVGFFLELILIRL